MIDILYINKENRTSLNSKDALWTSQLLNQGLFLFWVPPKYLKLSFLNANYPPTMFGYLNSYEWSIIVFKSCILNIDTIQEGSKIFLLNDGCLMDSSTALRNFIEVYSLESNIVLFLFFLADDDSFRGINPFIDFESQKVLDLEGLHKTDILLFLLQWRWRR